MDCGATFLIPAPGLGNTHLWVVATPPDPDCILVSLTTLRFDRDQTVVLHAGDHPFVRHQTVVLYSDARIVRADALEAQVRAGTAKSACALFQRDGAADSGRNSCFAIHAAEGGAVLSGVVGERGARLRVGGAVGGTGPFWKGPPLRQSLWAATAPRNGPASPAFPTVAG